LLHRDAMVSRLRGQANLELGRMALLRPAPWTDRNFAVLKKEVVCPRTIPENFGSKMQSAERSIQ
jgi:hypothetical protein